MTQYLLSVHPVYDPDLHHTEEDMQQMFTAVAAFNAELQASSSWVFAGGLEDPETATVVDGTGTAVTVTDGPFLETKEHLGGLWIIEAPDLDAALEIAARGSKACALAVEVRPFQQMP